MKKTVLVFGANGNVGGHFVNQALDKGYKIKAFVRNPEKYISQILLAIIAVLIVGLGGGIYLVANLGAGPRDGLMVGLQKKTNLPIAIVRAFLEITVMSIGWYLGGTVGVGTLLFAFGIGPAVALSLFIVGKFFN